MSPVKPLLLGAGLPFVVAGTLLLILWAVSRRRTAVQDAGVRGIGLAVTAGYIAAHLALMGWPSFPPSDAQQTVIYLCLVSAVVCLLEESRKLPSAVRALVRVGTTALCLGTLLKSRFQYHWSIAEGLLWCAVMGAAILVVWYLMDRLAGKAGNFAVSASLVIPFAIGSGILIFSGAASLGQLAGAAAAALSVPALFALWYRGRALAQGMVPVVVTLLVCLVLNGYFYNEMPWPAAILMFAAVLGAWIGELRFLRNRWPGRWQLAAASMCAVTLPLLAALFLAYQAYDPVGQYPY